MSSPRKRRVFPFTAVIGQEEMKLALLLNVIDPRIGGVMIMGDRGTGKSTTIRALADLLPGIEVVASLSADWDREKGMKVAEDILQAHPDLDVFVASNDEMAMGALQAVKSAGKLGQVAVVGDDAIPAALEALQKGELLATIDGNTDKVGYEAVKAAHDFLVNGTQPPEWLKVPSTVMFQDDVTDAYLKARGISF